MLYAICKNQIPVPLKEGREKGSKPIRYCMRFKILAVSLLPTRELKV